MQQQQGMRRLPRGAQLQLPRSRQANCRHLALLALPLPQAQALAQVPAAEARQKSH